MTTVANCSSLSHGFSEWLCVLTPNQESGNHGTVTWARNTACRKALAFIAVIMDTLPLHAWNLLQPNFELLLCQNPWQIPWKTMLRLCFLLLPDFIHSFQNHSNTPHPLQYVTWVCLLADFPTFSSIKFTFVHFGTSSHLTRSCSCCNPVHSELSDLAWVSCFAILGYSAERHYNPLIDALCA